MRMKGEEQGEATGASSSPAVISALDRYAGIFRGRKARLSRVRALRAPPQAPLTAAPRPQDGRRSIKDGPCVDGCSVNRWVLIEWATSRKFRSRLTPIRGGRI